MMDVRRCGTVVVICGNQLWLWVDLVKNENVAVLLAEKLVDIYHREQLVQYSPQASIVPYDPTDQRRQLYTVAEGNFLCTDGYAVCDD